MQIASEALEGNQEARMFEGVQGDATRKGELFGVRNLILFNPKGSVRVFLLLLIPCGRGPMLLVTREHYSKKCWSSKVTRGFSSLVTLEENGCL
jgi:hypothetical protein